MFLSIVEGLNMDYKQIDKIVKRIEDQKRVSDQDTNNLVTFLNDGGRRHAIKAVKSLNLRLDGISHEDAVDHYIGLIALGNVDEPLPFLYQIRSELKRTYQ
jgi:hypothetical protein